MSWVGDALVELRSCVGDALVEKGGGEVCWLGILPGLDVPLEFCSGECGSETCGMAWVRLSQTYPSTTFPDQDVAAGNCRKPIAHTIEVGVARCLPVMDTDGSFPAPEDFLDVTLSLTDDIEALRYAIACCFGSTRHTLGAWTPFGPDGGCVGGTWTVTVTS